MFEITYGTLFRVCSDAWRWRCRRPELAAVEKAGVPPCWVAGVPRPLLRAEVDTVEAKPEPVSEQDLEDVHERPHEVSMHVRSVPDREKHRLDIKQQVMRPELVSPTCPTDLSRDQLHSRRSQQGDYGTWVSDNPVFSAEPMAPRCFGYRGWAVWFPQLEVVRSSSCKKLHFRLTEKKYIT